MIVRDDRLWLSLAANHCVCVCNMSLGSVGVQVWSSETVDGHGEGQVETGHANGPRAVKDGCEAWTEGPRWLED